MQSFISVNCNFSSISQTNRFNIIKQGRTSTAEKSNLGAVLHKFPLQAQIRAVSPWYWPILHRSWLSGTGAVMQRLQYQKEKKSVRLLAPTEYKF